jgi:putative RNA 2'-phosphotransferase
MDREQVTQASKKLSWLLRHGARESGVAMDAAGWAPVAEVLRALRMTRSLFDEAVATNTKSRLEIAGDRVRASQGHSPSGTPVTLDALEASWASWSGEGPLWHGTHANALPGIARLGILSGERTHAHLTDSLESAVGKRSQVDVMLEVSPALLRAEGIGIHRSPNGVILIRHVPPACIVGLVPMTKRARADEARLRAAFGWPARS